MFPTNYVKQILMLACLIAPSAGATDLHQEFAYVVPENFASVRALLESDALDPALREQLETLFNTTTEDMEYLDLIEGVGGTAKNCSLMAMFVHDDDDSMDDFIGGMIRSFTKSYEPAETYAEPIIQRTAAEHHHGFELLTAENAGGVSGETLYTYIKQYDDGFISIAHGMGCNSEETRIDSMLASVARKQSKQKPKTKKHMQDK